MKNKLIKYGALIAVVIVLLSTTILPTFAAALTNVPETYDFDFNSQDGVAQSMNGVQSATLNLTGTSSSNDNNTLAWTYYMDNLVADGYNATYGYNGRFYYLRVGGAGDYALQRFSFYTDKIDLINPTNIYCTCWYDLGNWQIQFLVDYYDSEGNKLESVSQSYDMTSEVATYSFAPDVSSGEAKYARVCLNFYNDTNTTSSAVGRINIRGFGFDYLLPVDQTYYEGYEAGYNKGLEVGLQQGYQNGYDEGIVIGAQQGYDAGFNASSSSTLGLNLLGSTLAAPMTALNQFVLFEYDIGFGSQSITLGQVIGGAIALTLVIAFLRLFAGG